MEVRHGAKELGQVISARGASLTAKEAKEAGDEKERLPLNQL